MSTPEALPSLPRPVAVLVGTLLVVAAALQVGAGAVNAATLEMEEPVQFGYTNLTSDLHTDDVSVSDRLWTFRGMAAGTSTALLLLVGVVLIALSGDDDEGRWDELRDRTLLGAAVLASVVVAANALCLYDALTSDEPGFFGPPHQPTLVTALNLAAPSVIAAGVLLARDRLIPSPPALDDFEDDESVQP